MAIHDTTEVEPHAKGDHIAEFEFSGGFFAHLSLIVGAQQKKIIFGAGGLRLYSRTARRTKIGSSGEQHRWLDQILEVEAQAGNLSLIHVMDREADMHKNWSSMKDASIRFVIRAKTDRYVKTKGDKSRSRLFEEMSQVPSVAERQVTLSKRCKVFSGSKSSHQSRKTRVANLNISAYKFEVHKTYQEMLKHKETVELNVVRVFEVDVKAGDQPVEWLLITSEPIDTPEKVSRVVDIYRRRWLIEEFFKALKSGCKLEQRQFAGANSWYKLVTMFLPAAVTLLNLRLHESKNLNSSTGDGLTSVQLKILALKAAEFKKPFNSYRDAQYVLAQLGGHIATNGAPGWITLMKGYRKLTNMATGYNLACRDM